MIHYIRKYFLLYHVVTPHKTTWRLSLCDGLIRNRDEATWGLRFLPKIKPSPNSYPKSALNTTYFFSTEVT